MKKTSLLLRNAGFTMIELLVVIAVIGVLAVAVLSTINPIEQINKGRDTRSRSDAAQMIGAVDRYFAIHEKYPWNSNDSGQDGSFADGWEWDPQSNVLGVDLSDYRTEFEFSEASMTQNSDWAWLVPLVNTAEVKESFGSRLAQVTDNTVFYVYKPTGANKTMYVCFEPASYSFDLEATERCTPGSDKFDSQLVSDVSGACGDHDTDAATNCLDSTSDDDKCWICLP